MRPLIIINEIGSLNYVLPFIGHLNNRQISCSVIAGELVKQYIAETAGPRPKINLQSCIINADGALADGNFDICLTSATGTRTEFEAMEACRKRNVPCVSYIDTWVNYQWRFLDTDCPRYPDFILVPDKAAEEEAVAEGLPREKLVVIGQPAFEGIGVSARGENAAVFLDQPDPRDTRISYGYSMKDAWQLVCEHHKNYPNAFSKLIFCPHPERRSPDIELPDSVEVREFKKLMPSEFSIVFGVSSTAMVESFLMGKSVVSVQPGHEGDNIDPLSRQGKIPRVSNRAQLLDLLMNIDGWKPSITRNPFAGSLERLNKFIEEQSGV